jgi:hypothetical protein
MTPHVPPKITMTGVDRNTNVLRLPPGVEWGFLFTTTPEGRNRYPSRRELACMMEHFGRSHVSLHICGRGARELLMEYRIPDLTHQANRIQVNGEPSPEELLGICKMYSDHEIITQHTHRNMDLLAVDAPNHSLLVDGSGGRGLSPERWERPDTKKRVGFAGGLGPDNFIVEYPKIKAVGKHGFWVDMEGKLRDEDDWFDVDKAWEVIYGL